MLHDAIRNHSLPDPAVCRGPQQRQFLGIAGLFWVYVTLSNILYAYSMRIGISRMTNVSLFAAWDARLLQHLMLLPVLAGVLLGIAADSVASAFDRAAAAAILGTVFAALAYPGHDRCGNDSGGAGMA